MAALIFLFQTLGATGDTDSSDPDVSTDAAAHDGLSSYLSVRNFVAFFLGYGWITLAVLLSGASKATASLFGAAAGLVFVVASFFLIKTFLRFQEDGSLKLESLVGKHASVYITIGARGSFAGKVLVDARTGRVELPARSDAEEDLRPGSLVRVVKIEDDVIWVE
ncbi:MAG: hypothetical protein LBL73_06210 [Synergistaceae bacterium]|nr:hypothetical protein [Synergistaceae bacterium]